MSSIELELTRHLMKRSRAPDDYRPNSSTRRPSELPTSNKDEIELEDSESDYWPSAPLPPKAPVGPALPTFRNAQQHLDSDSDSDTGPALPKLTKAPNPR
ncbi:hypothetical protein CEK25_001310 [Fusarium fujikuroi]|nr:hypothetical protein CEK25_001310 [Fusarium fujikuroi]